MENTTTNWQGFLALAPERVREVIEDGPMPYPDYGAHKTTARDKRFGMLRFKGGTGRGGIPAKHGHKAVVYFDPDFVIEVEELEVPDKVKERHSDENVVAAFEKL